MNCAAGETHIWNKLMTMMPYKMPLPVGPTTRNGFVRLVRHTLLLMTVPFFVMVLQVMFTTSLATREALDPSVASQRMNINVSAPKNPMSSGLDLR